MYTNPAITSFVAEQFLPIRVHARQQREEFQELGARFGAHWTPTILLVDRHGQERHRIEGFLPVDEFLAQLKLGAAHVAFAEGRFADAARGFDELAGNEGDEASAEALYWAGVARYKETGDAQALVDTAQAFTTRHTGSSWAKKASVWAAT